uniref:Uncharacterized protein n=1 Tax=Sphaerodactylus townsendi TaxID=933632 RepID=A0ACB8FS71_9SAUR
MQTPPAYSLGHIHGRCRSQELSQQRRLCPSPGNEERLAQRPRRHSAAASTTLQDPGIPATAPGPNGYAESKRQHTYPPNLAIVWAPNLLQVQ